VHGSCRTPAARPSVKQLCCSSMPRLACYCRQQQCIKAVAFIIGVSLVILSLHCNYPIAVSLRLPRRSLPALKSSSSSTAEAQTPLDWHLGAPAWLDQQQQPRRKLLQLPWNARRNVNRVAAAAAERGVDRKHGSWFFLIRRPQHPVCSKCSREWHMST
jgi:hypothetical protein